MAVMKWQKVSLPIRQGVDTKTDSKALEPGKLANLENGVFTKGGSIIKRNGYDKLSGDIINVTPNVSGARGMYTKDDELLLADGGNLLSYIPTTNQWSPRGRFKAPAIATDTVFDTDDKQKVADCATLDGVTVYAWEHNDEGVYMSIASEETGAVCLGPSVIRLGSSRPKVVAVGTAIHVYIYDGGTIYRVIVHPSNIGYVAETLPINLYTSVVTDAHGSDCRYDIAASDGDAFIAYYTSSGSNKLKVLRTTPAGAVTYAQDYTESNAISCISIAREPNTGKLCVAWHNASDGVKAYILDQTLQPLHLSVLEGSVMTGATPCLNIAGAFKRDAVTRALLYSLDLEASSLQYAQYKESVKLDDFDLRDDLTIELWFKAESTTNPPFVSRHEGGAGFKGYYFRWDTTLTKLQFAFHDAGGVLRSYVSTATWTPVVGYWNHVAVTKDRGAGIVKFYVNGVQLGSDVAVNTDVPVENSSRLRVGHLDTGSATYADGMFSDLRIWNVVRSVSDIAGAKDAELTTYPAGLKGYWKFNNSYVDEISGANLTPSSGPVFVYGGPSITASDTETIEDNYQCVIFYEYDSPDHDDWHWVGQAAIAIYGDTVAATNTWKRHCGLASRAWADENDVHVNVVFATTLQTTYFTYMDDGTMVSKMTGNVSSGIVTEKSLPNVQDLGGGVYQWVSGYRKRLDTTASDPDDSTDTANAVYTAPGIKRHRMDYSAAPAMAQVGKTAYFSGGQIWQYDGAAVTEAGFSVFPERFTAARGADGATYLEEGIYYYKVYLAWTNANGEKERSTVAAPIKVTTITSNRKVAVTIPTVSHTNKLTQRGLTPVQFEVYRTLVTPSINAPYYKVSSDDPLAVPAGAAPNKYMENRQDVDFITFYDELPDDDAAKRERDYQNSGELQNMAPPAASIIAEGKDRIFLAGVENTSEIFYSKIRFAAEPVNFFAALRLTIPEDGGAITALRVLNNNLIVFKKRAIYLLSGNGPNNLGFGEFGPPQLVSSDVGCKDQRTIAEIPPGIMFQSDKGIYMLSRQHSVSYVGATVESYNEQTFTAAATSAKKNQVVFLTSSGRTLLFDYLFNQWSTFTNHEGAAATVWNGSICYAKSDGTVFRESTTNFTDAGAPVKLKLETAWVKLDTLQGFQRIRRAMVLGEFRSGHRLAMDVAYNYEGVRRRLVFDAAEEVSPTTFGDPLIDNNGVAVTFGDGTPFGSGTVTSEMESTVYQFRAHLPIQKCQSVKFYFEDIESVGGTLAESYEITELMLEVGIKRSGFKIADSRSI